ncbi:hypothetical protein GCM10010358_55600 [Streptomyces minutiscleroticus]|uniref:Uncharacterized protein n=1 Tax=Streptomyces minutiscleroticus TaxID=68238 RepID=A0A918NU86_9ACTN|nr:hypothetical protein GCM10010358_55600 [Streptomyces minutiscleroticus]
MVLASWRHSTSVPLLSSQASSRGRRAVIEFTFQVAMRMDHNLPGGCDNGRPEGRGARPRPPAADADRLRGPAGRWATGAAQRSVEEPGASRRCSVPPSAPIWRS